MKIVVDSTEYRQDRGLNKEYISLLRDLGKKKLITIHIPWFVYKECSSTSIVDLQTEYKNIITKLVNSDKKGLYHEDFEKIKIISESLTNLKNNINDSVNNNWADFIKESNAILHKFEKDDAEEVFTRYFTGEKPFKSIKNRDDIPDAFIYLTISKIANDAIVYLVSNDNNLTTKCSENKNIKIYQSLKDLFECEDFKIIKEKYYSLLEKENFENARKIIIDQKDIIEERAIDFVHTLSNVQIEDPKIHSDNNDATLNGFSFEEFNLNEYGIKHIGDEIFVQIEISGYGLIDYFIYKADYWTHEDLPKFTEDWNDHYFRVEEEVHMKIIKTLSFNIQSVISDAGNDLDLDISITDYDTLEII